MSGGIREFPQEPAPVEKPYWSVTVSINGEPVLTIEPHMLAGIPDIDKYTYTDQVREAGQHLVSFAGPENYHDPFLEDLFAEEAAAAPELGSGQNLADATPNPRARPHGAKDG
jgi:hypothetical protein